MKPGTTKNPSASSVSAPSYAPSPAITPSQIATSTSSHSRVNTLRTRPAADDEIGSLVAPGDGQAPREITRPRHQISLLVSISPV